MEYIWRKLAEGDDDDEEPTNQTQSISATILFMLSLLLINEFALSQYAKLKQKYPKLGIIQPTTITTTIGLLAGLILNLTDIINIRSVMKEGFSSFFLIVLLPPILYESALNMERDLFFKNFGTIIIYAIFGTLIATIVSAGLMYGVTTMLNMEDLNLTACFAFGALISATDPVAVLSIFKEVGVDSTLFSLIFGESILNDAVAIILYDTTVESTKNKTNIDRSIFNFLTMFIGSILIGLFIGMVCAFILKKNKSKSRKDEAQRETQENRETTILFVVPYVTYFISQGFNMSGIVSIMFCGIAMTQYALHNVSVTTEKLNKRLYHTLAYACETIIFIFIGIGFVSFDLAWKEAGVWLIVLAIIIILLARFINIVSISFIVNYYRRSSKISMKFQFFLWFSGFRGAMAFALSLKSTEVFIVGKVGQIMLTITLLISMLNIFVNATVLHPLIMYYDIQQKQIQQDDEEVQQPPQEIKGFWNKFKYFFTMCDQKFLKKILLSTQQQNQQEEQESHLHEIEEDDQKKEIKQNLIPESGTQETEEIKHPQEIELQDQNLKIQKLANGNNDFAQFAQDDQVKEQELQVNKSPNHNQQESNMNLQSEEKHINQNYDDQNEYGKEHDQVESLKFKEQDQDHQVNEDQPQQQNEQNESFEEKE